MTQFRRFLFVVLDATLPDLWALATVRGSIARIILGFKEAKGLRLGRGVDFKGFIPQITIGPGCLIGKRCVFDAATSHISLGSHCTIGDACIFRAINAAITIGSGCLINQECVFWAGTPINIGTDVGIGIQSIFWTGSHEVGDETKRAGKGIILPISIGDGCWIGVRCVIHKDVGSGCIVDTSSTVITPVANNTHVFGNPATVLKRMVPVNDAATPNIEKVRDVEGKVLCDPT